MKTSKLSIRLLWYITPLVILPLLFLGGFTLTNVTNSTKKQAELIVSRFVEQQQQKIFNYIDSFHSITRLLSTSPVLADFLSREPGSKKSIYRATWRTNECICQLFRSLPRYN